MNLQIGLNLDHDFSYDSLYKTCLIVWMISLHILLGLNARRIRFVCSYRREYYNLLNTLNYVIIQIEYYQIIIIIIKLNDNEAD